MAKKTKIERGFYPIYTKDIRRMIGYCETWGYGNKETCKYVSENVIEQLRLKYPNLKISNRLDSDLISIVHDINSGGNYSKNEILIPILN